MDFVSTLQIAFRALLRNKTRSILTMLGIIIGVGAVIAMISIGQGADRAVQKEISQSWIKHAFRHAGLGKPGRFANWKRKHQDAD